jgi:hypothetical protein
MPDAEGPTLFLGGGQLDRSLPRADLLLTAYRTDAGLRYLDFQPSTDRNRLMPEDLAVTILVNSRVRGAAFASVQDRSGEIDLASLPDVPLHETTTDHRRQLAKLIADIARWKGLAASVATKVLHKKRPQLVPILDNQAIFGAYMNPRWPESRSMTESVYAESRIRKALEWIFTDLTREENAVAWSALSEIEPSRSRIELFDMVWWVHFRKLEPVKSKSPI